MAKRERVDPLSQPSLAFVFRSPVFKKEFDKLDEYVAPDRLPPFEKLAAVKEVIR